MDAEEIIVFVSFVGEYTMKNVLII
jgi:hypothetical protein